MKKITNEKIIYKAIIATMKQINRLKPRLIKMEEETRE